MGKLMGMLIVGIPLGLIRIELVDLVGILVFEQIVGLIRIELVDLVVGIQLMGRQLINNLG